MKIVTSKKPIPGTAQETEIERVYTTTIHGQEVEVKRYKTTNRKK